MSNALLGMAYGKNFRYAEYMMTGKSVKGFFSALAIVLGTPLFFILCFFPPTRWLLKRFLPNPGEGPSKHVRETGYFNANLVGMTEPQGSESSRKVFGFVKGIQDPGYAETSKMICESALCIALQSGELTAKVGGVYTPASCMGMALVERLRNQGMTFDAYTEHSSKY